MIRLYIKTISAALFVLLLGTFGFWYLMQDAIHKSSNRTNQILSEGNFHVIENYLEPLQQASWDKAIQNIPMTSKDRIQLKLIEDLSLTKKDALRLNHGEIIYVDGANKIFLTYGLHPVYAYKKIHHSPYAIKITTDVTMNQVIYDVSSLMVNLVSFDIKNLSPEQQKKRLAEISGWYKVPIFKVKKNKLNSSVQRELSNYMVSIKSNLPSKPIDTFFIQNRNGEVFKIGPIKYPYFSLRLFNVQIYLLVGLVFLTLLVVVIMTWLFSRNVKKLTQITREFSRAKFSNPLYVNKLSTLSPLYNNIIKMGRELEDLIDKQKNMTKFVAHEIRTPLYTMQLASDDILYSKEKGDWKDVDGCIKDIQEDIDSLNELVATFLTYAQVGDKGLKMNPRIINIIKWVQLYVDDQSRRHNDVSLRVDGNDTVINVKIDEKHFTYILNNLISNARKFRHECIQILLRYSDSHIYLSVDDDGDGLNEVDAESLFSAFSTLQMVEHKSYKHMGLGLEIALNIIRQFPEGKLYYENSSTLGGARFTIEMSRNLD